jgi:hypothetical protein
VGNEEEVVPRKPPIKYSDCLRNIEEYFDGPEKQQ